MVAITSKKSKDISGKAARQYWLPILQAHARTLLAEKLVMSPEDFHRHMNHKFYHQVENWAVETLKGSSRTRFDNLIDWVKAHLTMQKQTAYTRINDVDYIVWCPAIGSIEGHGQLISRAHLLTVLGRIAAV